MRRRSVLKWFTLATLSIVVVLMSLSFLNHDRTAAAGNNTKPQTQGSLQVLDKDGKPAGACPLKHTEVKAQVSGFLSRVTVTQDFENALPEKIEAVYTFPLPQAAAVDDLTMVVGERIIKGKIMRREEAQATYTAAKETGKIASLLDQEQPNLFMQQVANILPGQQIRIIISYVETLQYEDGAYEWSFPMVAAPRYMPNKESSITEQQLHHATLAPASASDGVRAGHDISLEIDLDAGVPIVGVDSGAHETEVQQINERRAVVRLKDRTTIPNKDFVLTYRVAGETIDDAVLTHRSERGGFFTLILQPPQRVAPADVMPKELVFVLDTSGSMSGFPIEKAKQTMDLALSTLYPHDTFNLITFSGDTDILFSEPVPATPENVKKARKFLASRKGEGGTEMMKAIQGALDPSDSQYHVRIACFMTDGQVGNENEIISEVQKHPNARVFAMGFGPAPNRHLLDKMSQYGRGEVNYVPETGDTSSVAQRFNERVRNPLLTDISIDWGNLPVSDVYPKRIPDLFSARPLTVSGRYTQGGKGIIRLKGKMAGQDFVREIPVELPETETDHDVLSTLWARRRIDDLMGEEIANVQNKPAQDQLRQEITQLGLDYKLMTQYTSFIAVDEVMFTGGEEPKRVEVPASPGTMQLGLTGYVTVTGASCVMVSSTQTSSLNRSLQDLPLQGRSFTGLLELIPGVVGAGRDGALQGVFSVNGHRSNSNEFKVDGVNAKFGIAAGGESPGPSASGNVPALTASGGANGIVTLDATQEIRVETPPASPEDGRASGAQVNLVSRSGTNNFHGSAFHFFGNDVFDASDWFANSHSLKEPPKRLNLFGATFSGPIRKDQTFLFASYEGMHLRQPMVGITDVPSFSSRAIAPAAQRSFFEAFPIPNGTAKSDGFAEYAASFANPARHDVGSIRVDHALNSNLMLRGRYNFADSEASLRGANGFSLNTTNRINTSAQTVTGSLSQTLSPTMVLELHANYSRSRVTGSYLLDEFGGAAVSNNLFPSSFALDLNSRNAALMFGEETASRQRQFSVAGSSTMISGNHTIKFGGDYRRLSPIIGQRAVEENVLFDGLTQALTGVAARVNHLTRTGEQNPVFTNLSLFGQHEWRPSSRLTLTYGLRWDLAPAPSSNGVEPLAVDQVSDPSQLKPAAAGTSLWKTTFLNFAPRAGFAYQLSETSDDLLLRGGIGIAYDLGQDRSGDAFADSIPFISGSSVFNSLFPISATTGTALPFMAFDPRLKLPYTIDWNVSLQRALGPNQALSAAYFGSSGKRLLHTETLLDQNADFPFLRLVTNRGSSDYRALQVRFERQFRDGFSAQASYTWSRSLDNVNDDSARTVIMSSTNPALDRGPSDFDLRHQLTGFASYELPSPSSQGVGNKLLRNWTVDSIFNARSAKPLNVVYLLPTSFGVAYLRPNVVDGASFYVTDSTAAGGRRLNANAFLLPADLQQGNLTRNSLRGFAFYQIDLALRRRFNFSEKLALQIQADAFNLFNHPNFEDPYGNDLVVGSRFDTASFTRNLAFGPSMSLSGRSLAGGGFGSFYGFGGARTMRFSVKFLF